MYTFTLFWFNLFAGYSGQRMYDDWYHSMYNLIFTSMPVIAVGLLDQDVSKAHPLSVSSKVVMRHSVNPDLDVNLGRVNLLVCYHVLKRHAPDARRRACG